MNAKLTFYVEPYFPIRREITNLQYFITYDTRIILASRIWQVLHLCIAWSYWEYVKTSVNAFNKERFLLTETKWSVEKEKIDSAYPCKILNFDLVYI